jgi:hypothetical protein
MLVIAPKPTFTIPVNIHVPGQDEHGQISVTFNYKDVDELRDWQQRHGRKPVFDALKEVISTWQQQDVQDEHGNELPYTDESLQRVLKKYHTAGQDFTQAYLAEVLGAKRKN